MLAWAWTQDTTGNSWINLKSVWSLTSKTMLKSSYSVPNTHKNLGESNNWYLNLLGTIRTALEEGGIILGLCNQTPGSFFVSKHHWRYFEFKLEQISEFLFSCMRKRANFFVSKHHWRYLVYTMMYTIFFLRCGTTQMWATNDPFNNPLTLSLEI